MWIFTKKGMISIVQHREDPNQLVVRARRPEHLEAIFPGEQIIRIESADYRFRVIMPRSQVHEVMTQQIDDIDYDNFKSSLTDADYHDACLEVWATMTEFQRTRKPFADTYLNPGAMDDIMKKITK